jgi:hypothetical protein
MKNKWPLQSQMNAKRRWTRLHTRDSGKEDRESEADRRIIEMERDYTTRRNKPSTVGTPVVPASTMRRPVLLPMTQYLALGETERSKVVAQTHWQCRSPDSQTCLPLRSAGAR